MTYAVLVMNLTLSIMGSKKIITRADIDELKKQWLYDPIWDIEETEGFEDFRDELLAWRLDLKNKREAERLKINQDRAEKIGIPGNVEHLKYLESLEFRIERLEENFEKLKQNEY